MPLAGTKTPNVSNASRTNCNCLPVREQNGDNAYTKRDIENEFMPNTRTSIPR